MISILSQSAFALCLWLIPAAPLVAAIGTAFLGHRVLKQRSHWPCVLALGFSCVLSILVLLSPAGFDDPVVGYPWIVIGGLEVKVTLQADALTSVMLVAVTLVSTLVAVYSIGYMRDHHGHPDPGYPRYFAEIALFVFSMTMLVLAANFLLLYVFWEAVGLCSYLLIGYWYQRPSASAAARKAFLVNRIGDFGFAIGIFLIWTQFGSLDYKTVFFTATFEQEMRLTLPDIGGVGREDLDWKALNDDGREFDGTMLAICLLLLMGAVGKSAQFPLHVWLPDAMEGPSPVSALIHAATMVTAGVYMVARCTPLFVLAPEAQLVVAGIGGFTALLAALIALTQNDLKRVLAYSTVSQLGYMFLALGSAAGQPKLAAFAAIAAIFHLFTHAFFKALLFLGAGSVMHAMGDVIDMRRFGGLRHVLRHTHWTFLIGAAALAGVPLVSGFWSKDEVLASVYEGTHGPYTGFFQLLLIGGLVTAGVTAFYTFRAYFMTFWGETRFPPEAGEHPHESPAVMLYPLMILAVFAALAGLIVGPTHLFAGHLEQAEFLKSEESHGLNWIVMGFSILAALAGIGLAWRLYGKTRPESRTVQLTWWYQLSANKFYLDEIYTAFVVKPVRAFAIVCRIVDQYIVDGLVDLVGWMPALVGRLFRPVQNGLVQFYALAMLLGLTVFVIALVVRLTG